MPSKSYFVSVEITRSGSLGGGLWSLKQLEPITVLFGKNGSGKSLLLRAWRDTNMDTSHYIAPERVGDLGFEPGYLQQQGHGQGRRSLSVGNYVGAYRQQVLTRIQNYFLARGAIRSEQLPGNVEDLEQLFSTLFPDFSLELIGATPGYKIRRTENQQEIGNVEQLSSGEAQLLTIGIDILTIAAIWDLQKSPIRLLLIDEPDAHIHPDLQARFADFIVQVANKYDLQVAIATHSTTLLAALGQFGKDNCGVIYLDRIKTEFQTQKFTSSLKEIASCLGGHALMGPLFGTPLLLVEGDDDYRVWSQVPRHHVVNFSVIPCNGQEIYEYQATLEKIFESLRDKSDAPAGYALLDHDKSLPQPNPDAPQNHVKFIRLNCHEVENLFLTDEVLNTLNKTWADASASIIASSGKHGNKAADLAKADKWKRQEDDIKNLINEISLAIDTKNVHWTQRLGVAIGRSKPTGQLANFLGEEVMKAIWGNNTSSN